MIDTNKLWRSPDKEPEDLKWILFKCQGAVIDKGYYDKTHCVVVAAIGTVNWSSVTKWCYVEDIDPYIG